ncbi:MAG TPA: hypothetical protein DHV48_20150 [Prolixibacteraceae bacterium]|nr:hypothetical protein [Prolixibacteraceae bacterium]
MKAKIFLISFWVLGLTPVLWGQITDGEAKLRKQNSDTIQGWKKGGVIALNLAQTSLTNWAAGGQNSFAVNGLFSGFSNFKNEKTVWDNSLDMGYGLLKQGKNSDYMKTDDKFDFLSKYGRQAFNDFYYAALVNFKTQMTVGKDYAKDTAKISNFLAPAFLIGAIGMDYKPNSYFSAFLAPLTGKITIVNDQQLANAGAFGVTPATYDNLGNLLHKGEKSKSELGGYIRLIYSKNDFKYEIFKGVSFTSKLDLFSNYLKKPQNIDISWETQIAFKVNKYISANINTHLLYDDDIAIAIDSNNDGITDKSGPRIQFKEILGVGFSYKL